MIKYLSDDTKYKNVTAKLKDKDVFFTRINVLYKSYGLNCDFLDIWYQSFNEDYGYKVMALFDVNPKLIGISVRGVKVLDTDELENFIKTHGIKIAALTIPKDQAPAIAKKMAEWGIKGFWNFAPIDLHLPDNVTVENVHLAESLMTLTYNVHNREESENE